jgi:hypothetical protein
MLGARRLLDFPLFDFSKVGRVLKGKVKTEMNFSPFEGAA